ncbi:hypothetical protein SAMN05216304_11461 [Bosea sp. OK403]|nr:hypothetical protein SAMN05216304_11461 [Bosea sp. OK403]
MQSVVYTTMPRIDRAPIERAKRINVADLHDGSRNPVDSGAFRVNT